MGNKFQRWLNTKGIHHEVTNPGTPQENSMAEQLNRTILEIMRIMLMELDLLKIFWTFAVSYTQEILNRLPTQTLNDNKTPYEIYYGKKPSMAHLQVFRCNAYVHVPDKKRGKLDAKIVKGLFVGLPKNKKGYMVLNHLPL